MPTTQLGKATLGEKLDVVLGIGEVIIKTVFTLLHFPFASASKSQPTLGQELVRLVIRRLVDRFNAVQIQWVMLPSTVAYRDWMATRAKAEDTPSQTITELIGEEGAKIHWVGRRDATKVIIHYHGGGFIMPLHKGHLSMINYFRREIKRRSGVEVKLAFPEYTLTPLATYPTQFRQAVVALKHVLDSGISPADILISGDSAGGLLAFQILSHLLHPHPSIPLLPAPGVPFAGLLAMSPWVVFDSTAHSFTHHEKDTVSSTPLLTWGRMVRDGTVLADGGAEPGGYWCEPLKAPPEWWRDTSKVAKHVLFTYGAWETLRDDGIALSGNLKKGVAGSVEVTVVEEPKGLHDNPTTEFLLGQAPSDLSNIIAGWVYDRVNG